MLTTDTSRVVDRSWGHSPSSFMHMTWWRLFLVPVLKKKNTACSTPTEDNIIHLVSRRLHVILDWFPSTLVAPFPISKLHNSHFGLQFLGQETLKSMPWDIYHMLALSQGNTWISMDYISGKEDELYMVATKHTPTQPLLWDTIMNVIISFLMWTQKQSTRKLVNNACHLDGWPIMKRRSHNFPT